MTIPPFEHGDDLRRHAERAILLDRRAQPADDVYDQHAEPPATPPPAAPATTTPEPASAPAPVPQPTPPATTTPEPAPAPAPVPQPAAPATTTPEPAPAPTPQPTPPAPDLAEKRRAADARRAADQLRAKAATLNSRSKFWMGFVIAISIVITAFGSGNAHAVFLRHDTADPWAWFPYPAFEAALIVEIQIGGLLGEHKQSVPFWGTALRVVTALAAITLCVYGPAEQGDVGGAVLHASGPFVQFWLAEFLAHARPKFRAAVELLLDRADGRERAAQDPTAGASGDRSARSRKRSQKADATVRKTTPKTATDTSPGDQSSDSGTGPDLVLTPAEKKAYAVIKAKGLYPSKGTVIREVRAAGGAIGTTRALEVSQSWKTSPDGPALHAVDEKEAL